MQAWQIVFAITDFDTEFRMKHSMRCAVSTRGLRRHRPQRSPALLSSYGDCFPRKTPPGFVPIGNVGCEPREPKQAPKKSVENALNSSRSHI